MNASDAERLMQYLDGELPPAEAAEVERLIASSAEARALLANFEETAEVVREIGLDRASALADLTGPVMDRIAREDGLRAPGASSNVVHFGRYWAPAALALAAAAAFAIYVRPARGPMVASSAARPVVAENAPVPAAPASVAAAAEPEGAPEEEPGAEIESVDFGAQGGSIFMVASGLQVTPVVWLVDETTAQGGRMKPL